MLRTAGTAGNSLEFESDSVVSVMSKYEFLREVEKIPDKDTENDLIAITDIMITSKSDASSFFRTRSLDRINVNVNYERATGKTHRFLAPARRRWSSKRDNSPRRRRMPLPLAPVVIICPLPSIHLHNRFRGADTDL